MQQDTITISPGLRDITCYLTVDDDNDGIDNDETFEMNDFT